MSKHHFTFRKENYMLLLAGIGLVIIGFLLMIGGGSDNPNEFKGEELFSFRRITLAPFTVILGYVVVIWAIMKKPRTE
ncbi:MAG: DUF3098 domain-containing protein [Flavobacteriales bacterium]